MEVPLVWRMWIACGLMRGQTEMEVVGRCVARSKLAAHLVAAAGSRERSWEPLQGRPAAVLHTLRMHQEITFFISRCHISLLHATLLYLCG